MKIEKSICGKFVRVTVGQSTALLTISEWSRMLGRPGEFAMTPALVVIDDPHD